MANRVVMDANGLKISKPGVNVLTAGQDGLMFDSSLKMLQVIDSGTRTGSAIQTTVTIPNVGFRPFVWHWSPNTVYAMRFLSDTSLQFNRQLGATGTFHYVVLNVPMVP